MLPSFIDLHCHTTASDGSLVPEEVVKRAKSNGVRVLAITDHDTMQGYDRAKPVADELGVQLIPGIEVSSSWSRCEIHVVGLNVQTDSPALKDLVQEQGQRRLARAEEISARLANLGVKNALQGAQEFARGEVCRPHFAQFLVKAGYVRSMSQAFKQYLGNGKAGDVPCCWPHMKSVIARIQAAKGVAVLAHPGRYRVGRTKQGALVRDFSIYGGDALEVVVGGQPAVESQHFARLCERYQLQASVGSDYHGETTPWTDLGRIGALPQGCQAVWQGWVK